MKGLNKIDVGEVTHDYYDGLKKIKIGRYTSKRYNLYEALKQSNPRNVFLNGHLHIELKIDELLVKTLTGKSTLLEYSDFADFLKTRYIDYFGKIILLKMIHINHPTKNIEINLIDNDLFNDLNVIGAIRNAFHHNLDYDEAMVQLCKGGVKFSSIQKKFVEYDNIQELVSDFKEVVIKVHLKLKKLLEP
ncbi:MAG: hypothetical protein PHE43_01880 [Candidatus Nanoarchaeia archaeon]|nr:hypothetical protein [Candidatus Nanoarchaeia archaeon]